MAAYIASGTRKSWARFIDAFRKSQVGVVALGVPADAVGEFVNTADQPVSVGQARTGDRHMVLAFADPEAYAARFGRRFNATLTGEALLATVLLNPDCAGVRVNSALAKLSVLIERATIKSLVRARQPWWRLW
jgi:hypothetical protein